jgi:hypothetical protein
MKFSLVSALAISILLLIAAIAKWLNPEHLPFHLDRTAIFVEVCIAILLPIFYKRAGTWASLTAFFSLWLGYTLFWFIQNKNCGCFGNSWKISAGITTMINIIAIGLAFWNWGTIERGMRKKYLFILIDGLMLIIGFLIAVWSQSASTTI